MRTAIKLIIVAWLIGGVQAAMADEARDAVQVLSALWKGTFDDPKGRITTEFVGDGTATERVLLFCIGSDTDWQQAGVTAHSLQQMMVCGLIERQSAGSYALTDPGRVALRRKGLI